MSAARHEHPLSVAEYFALDDGSPDSRYEYLDGRIFMMSGDSRNHARISANIIQALGATPCAVFTSAARVTLNAKRYVYPDVSISCAKQAADDTQNVTDPTLVIEVLSPNTAAYDRGEKLQRYRECASLTTIILVDQDQPIVEVFRRQSVDIWTIQTFGLADCTPLDDIGMALPVAAIYRNIAFTDK
jgi:Uma2 family endonuclease